jgi:hypothetical protein
MMKHLATLAAAGALAAVAYPAQAADLQPAPTSLLTAEAAFTFQQSPMEHATSTANHRRDRRDDGRWRDDRYDRHGRYIEPGRLGRNDRIWRDRSGHYYCRRDNGTTGVVIGAGVGALVGRSIDTDGDRTVGTLLGAALGGVLGREIDRSSIRCR